jgi:hypothetical protein
MTDYESGLEGSFEETEEINCFLAECDNCWEQWKSENKEIYEV